MLITPDNKHALHEFQQALSEFNLGHLRRSMHHAENQLLLTPNHPDTLKLLATGFMHLQEHELAAKHIKALEKLIVFNTELNNLAGAIFLNSGIYDQAGDYFRKVLSISPEYSPAEYNLGLSYYNNKRYETAINHLSNFLKSNENNEITLTILGDCHLNIENYDAAITHYEKALIINPYSSKANLGLLTGYIKGRSSEEIESRFKSLQNNLTENRDILFPLANHLLANGFIELAIGTYDELLIYSPDNTTYLTHIAMAYDELEATKKAIDYLNQALSIDNDDLEAHSVLGNIYTNIREHKLAEQHLAKALAIDVDHIASNINMGRLKSFCGDYEESDRYYHKSISLDPCNVRPYFNLAYNARRKGDDSGSCQYLKKCLKLDPNHADAESNLGLVELSLGNFSAGWRHYFKRTRTINNETLSPITPGMSLDNSHVYLCKSQGLGDELLFLRFVEQLKLNNVRVSYRASHKIFQLLDGKLNVDQLLDEDSPLPGADYYFTVDDLPLILDIDSAEKIPPPLKIPVDAIVQEKIRCKFFKHSHKPYIGITWEAGTPEDQQSRKPLIGKLTKKIELEKIIELLKPINATIVILQRNPKQEARDYINSQLSNPIIDLSSYNENLTDMLAILSLIDEYVGVSNTNTHLYAAIGKKAKVLVPHPADWRWLVSGDNSPWLPGFPIYRQSIDGSWASAISRLKDDLECTYGK